MLQMQESTFQSVVQWCAHGDALANMGLHRNARSAYEQAWSMLPMPKRNHEQAPWIAMAMGEASFRSGDFDVARNRFSLALICIGTVDEPRTLVRLGQCALELGEEDVAADLLLRAFQLGGDPLFLKEDAKYLRFLERRHRALKFRKVAWKLAS